MKTLIALSLVLCGLSLGTNTAAAQEAPDGTTPPPKVFVIVREYVKPGQAGSMHEKTESAFVQAMKEAKWPTHYFAANSLSGPSRSLFFIGYNSFEAWEKDNQAMQKDATLSAALDSASIADGKLLSKYETSAFVYREDYSLRAPVKIAEMRYLEITQFVVRPGHRKDWAALVKIYQDAYEKALPSAHWATFESVYGASDGGLFLVVTPMKSLAEVDQNLGAAKQFAASMTESEQKEAADLSAACIQSSQTNLFAFNPTMSYVSEDWIKADPAFWSQK
ncbi:MAG: hypothetical protein ACYC46_01960 [Acidobacteriaceae bacterium]